jgi:uncharacterized membrane protein
MEASVMSRRQFRICGAAVMVAVVALIGWSMATGNALVPIPVAIGGAALLYLLRRQVKGVVEDERNYRLSEKASRLTIQVFAFLAAITGTTLIALTENDCSHLREVGLTLAFSACALLVLYMISYAYHSRKT